MKFRTAAILASILSLLLPVAAYLNGIVFYILTSLLAVGVCTSLARMFLLLLGIARYAIVHDTEVIADERELRVRYTIDVLSIGYLILMAVVIAAELQNPARDVESLFIVAVGSIMTFQALMSSYGFVLWSVFLQMLTMPELRIFFGTVQVKQGFYRCHAENIDTRLKQAGVVFK